MREPKPDPTCTHGGFTIRCVVGAFMCEGCGARFVPESILKNVAHEEHSAKRQVAALREAVEHARVLLSEDTDDFDSVLASTADTAKAFKARIRADERERCAKLLDAESATLPDIPNMEGRVRMPVAIKARMQRIAAAIRALGDGKD